MTTNIPKTDSIRELASFWNTHELTDFDDQLEEVTESVFERSPTVLSISLSPAESDALKAMAESCGIDTASLVRKWVQQNVQSPS